VQNKSGFKRWLDKSKRGNGFRVFNPPASTGHLIVFFSEKQLNAWLWSATIFYASSNPVA